MLRVAQLNYNHELRGAAQNEKEKKMEKFTTQQIIDAMILMAKTNSKEVKAWMLGYDELTMRNGDEWMDEFYDKKLAPLMIGDNA